MLPEHAGLTGASNTLARLKYCLIKDITVAVIANAFIYRPLKHRNDNRARFPVRPSLSFKCHCVLYIFKEVDYIRYCSSSVVEQSPCSTRVCVVKVLDLLIKLHVLQFVKVNSLSLFHLTLLRFHMK